MFSKQQAQRRRSLQETRDFWLYSTEGRELIKFFSKLEPIKPLIKDVNTASTSSNAFRDTIIEDFAQGHDPSDRFMDPGNAFLFETSLPVLSSHLGMPDTFVGKFLLKNVFRSQYHEVNFELAIAGLDYLEDLEESRKASLREAAETLQINEDDWLIELCDYTEAKQWVQKMISKESKIVSLYAKLFVNLRIWIMINHLRSTNFDKIETLALLNTLFPPDITNLPRGVELNGLMKYRSAIYANILAVDKNGPKSINKFLVNALGFGNDCSWWETRHRLDEYIWMTQSMITEARDIKSSTGSPPPPPITAHQAVRAPSNSYSPAERRQKVYEKYWKGEVPCTLDQNDFSTQPDSHVPLPSIISNPPDLKSPRNLSLIRKRTGRTYTVGKMPLIPTMIDPVTKTPILDFAAVLKPQKAERAMALQPASPPSTVILDQKEVPHAQFNFLRQVVPWESYTPILKAREVPNSIKREVPPPPYRPNRFHDTEHAARHLGQLKPAKLTSLPSAKVFKSSKKEPIPVPSTPQKRSGTIQVTKSQGPIRLVVSATSAIAREILKEMPKMASSTFPFTFSLPANEGLSSELLKGILHIASSATVSADTNSTATPQNPIISILQNSVLPEAETWVLEGVAKTRPGTSSMVGNGIYWQFPRNSIAPKLVAPATPIKVSEFSKVLQALKIKARSSSLMRRGPKTQAASGSTASSSKLIPVAEFGPMIPVRRSLIREKSRKRCRELADKHIRDPKKPKTMAPEVSSPLHKEYTPDTEVEDFMDTAVSTVLDERIPKLEKARTFSNPFRAGLSERLPNERPSFDRPRQRMIPRVVELSRGYKSPSPGKSNNASSPLKSILSPRTSEERLSFDSGKLPRQRKRSKLSEEVRASQLPDPNSISRLRKEIGTPQKESAKKSDLSDSPRVRFSQDVTYDTSEPDRRPIETNLAQQKTGRIQELGNNPEETLDPTSHSSIPRRQSSVKVLMGSTETDSAAKASQSSTGFSSSTAIKYLKNQLKHPHSKSKFGLSQANITNPKPRIPSDGLEFLKRPYEPETIPPVPQIPATLKKSGSMRNFIKQRLSARSLTSEKSEKKSVDDTAPFPRFSMSSFIQTRGSASLDISRTRNMASPSKYQDALRPIVRKQKSFGFVQEKISHFKEYPKELKTGRPVLRHIRSATFRSPEESLEEEETRENLLANARASRRGQEIPVSSPFVPRKKDEGRLYSFSS